MWALLKIPLGVYQLLQEFKYFKNSGLLAP